MAIICDPWFPPLTIKTEVGDAVEGYILTLKLAFMADGRARLVGTEKSIRGDAKARRHSFPVPEECFAELFSGLRGLWVPALPRFETDRTDGGLTELKIGGEDEGSTLFRWRGEPPKEWKGLGRFVRKVRFAYEELRRFAGMYPKAENPRLVASMPVAGLTHVPNIRGLLKGVVAGTALGLVREPENPYDANAIAVHLLDARGRPAARIGYVPRQRNWRLARQLDAGARYSVKVFDRGEEPGSTTMEIFIFNDDPEGEVPLDMGCKGSPPEGRPENGYEEKRADCMREGGDESQRELAPGDVREDLLEHLRGYETVIHTNAEKDYEYLDDGCYTVEVKNPAPGGQPLFLEIACEFTIFFADWHAHYFSYLTDYEHVVKDMLAILADEVCAAAIFNRDGAWHCSSSVWPPLVREEGARAALRSFMLGSEDVEALKPGGVIKVRYWTPAKNFDLPLE